MEIRQNHSDAGLILSLQIIWLNLTFESFFSYVLRELCIASFTYTMSIIYGNRKWEVCYAIFPTI